jgi:hypothetical protein
MKHTALTAALVLLALATALPTANAQAANPCPSSPGTQCTYGGLNVKNCDGTSAASADFTSGTPAPPPYNYRGTDPCATNSFFFGKLLKASQQFVAPLLAAVAIASGITILAFGGNDRARSFGKLGLICGIGGALLIFMAAPIANFFGA